MMSRSVSIGFVVQALCLARIDARITANFFVRAMLTLAAATILVGLLSDLMPAAYAQDATSGDPYVALRAYAQQIKAEAPRAILPPGDEAALASLLNYLSQTATTAPAQLKVADADNALDALREYLQKQNGTSPAPAKKLETPVPTKPAAPAIAGTNVGSKVCIGCHSEQANKFSHTLMGRLQTQGKVQCETCHGPGSEHARLGGGRGVGGIISFRADDRSRTVEDNNAICLGCHQRGERTYWDASVHETRGLACTNCHTVMKSVSRKAQLKTAFEPDTCFQCHKDKQAQTMFSSHMPIGEGKMVCSDCHNPHGSATDGLLRTDSINDTCYKCHAEKRGPFLVEHQPVRENCLNCHNPHGSVNADMLKLSTPRLCFECHGFGHGQTSGVNSVFTMGRACLNCHTAIHGSNSPAGFFLQR